jgi:phenylalanyl-tRNA synthetase beta chain
MLEDHEVVQALERAGIEIEQVILSKPIDNRVVVALVKKVVQHPGADRLRLVEVETGEGTHNVVCGAPNVRDGLKVAFAQIGATLPDGDTIEKVKLRGEVSEGMICSERELGIGKDHNGILELSNEAVVGTPICELYPGDTVVDIKTPANRFDVQSVVGLAREVAAMTTAELKPLAPPPVEISSGLKDTLSPKIEAKRYLLARLKIDQPPHSPLPMAARLRASGTRSIGPVVDVTNYVMLEMGQPLHAFDAAKVSLPIEVRHAKAGETLVTLDGVKRTLSQADLIIADAHGPIGLAGLMGGQDTEVSATTSEILLEAAAFDGVTVRKMAQRHGLRTEASARFEREIPVTLAGHGLERAVELLVETSGGMLESVAEFAGEKPKTVGLKLPVGRLTTLLGFEVSAKEAVSALGKLQIEAEIVQTSKNKAKRDDVVSLHNDQIISVQNVPWWRPDLKESQDLVEEVVRVLGYDRVPSTIPSWRPRHIEFDRGRAVRRRLNEVLWAAGAFEVMTYSFVSAEQLTELGLDLGAHLKLKNPLSSEQAYLRSSLLPSHLATLERNRTYAKTMRFYEMSRVFLKRGAGEQPDEPLRLAATVLEQESAYAVAKGMLDKLAAELGAVVTVRPAQLSGYASGRYGEVWAGKERIGGIGQLEPSLVRALKLDGEAAHLELDVAGLMAAGATRAYSARSAFPSIARDLTLILPEDVLWQSVKDACEGWDVVFVSDYYGSELAAGTKGLTVRLTLTYPDRTPTEAEAADLEEAVFTRLRHKFGAQRRD